jgi:hypothetical protein
VELLSVLEHALAPPVLREVFIPQHLLFHLCVLRSASSHSHHRQ